MTYDPGPLLLLVNAMSLEKKSLFLMAVWIPNNTFQIQKVTKLFASTAAGKLARPTLNLFDYKSVAKRIQLIQK